MAELNGTNQDGIEMHPQRPEGEISRRELLKLASPFGKVDLDSSQCTGCGLCEVDCPTGALVVSWAEEGDTYQLLFKYNLCIACAKCVEVCPEQCLRLERTLELDKLNRPAAVLFEDVVVRCSECGSPVASRAMIDRLQAKLAAAGDFRASQLGLCPACKIKAQFSLGGVE